MNSSLIVTPAKARIYSPSHLDSCLRRNGGEGNSCGMTLWVIQRSPSAGMVAGSCHSERSEESKATAIAYTSSLDSRSAPAPYPDTGSGMTVKRARQ